MQGAEKNGPREPSIHQMSVMLLPENRGPITKPGGEKPVNASLVGELCKVPGSFLCKSTNKPISNPLKNFPFFCVCVCKEAAPLNSSYLQSLLLSAYITCVLLTSLAPCYFFLVV